MSTSMSQTITSLSVGWLSGLPVAHQKTTFLDLPQEVRDQVYEHVLIADIPITVWIGVRQYEFRNWNQPKFTPVRRNRITLGCEAPGALRGLTLSLLRCSRTVHRDAAKILFGKNVFSFKGHDIWDPLFGFLNCIGPTNRSYLQHLRVDFKMPEAVQSLADGTVTSLGPWWSCKVLPRHQYNHTYHLGRNQPRAEEFSPAIEACFRILGDAGPKLNLTLDLEQGYLPGIWIGDEIQRRGPWFNDWSLELPNLFQSLNQNFGGLRVAVVWQGVFDRGIFTRWTESVKKEWDILETENMPDHKMKFALRRRQVEMDTS